MSSRTIACVLVAALTLIGCNEGGASDVDGNPEDYSSHCDRHGNRVYLSEDDSQSSPGILVLEGGCEP